MMKYSIFAAVMEKLYFAPIQGFTDFVFRKAYADTFSGIDTFFIPYITLKNGEITKKYLKEINPENNPYSAVVPQVLAGDQQEMIYLCNFLKDAGFTQINLNLGCPYPMVSKRMKGSGLLPFPDTVKRIIEGFYKTANQKLSVKLRAGLTDAKEIDHIIPVLNDFPLTEVIFHPRIATQLYGGKINETRFDEVQRICKHPLVYNGDIFCNEDFKRLQLHFPETGIWMLGRGILKNPFLPAEIKGIPFTENEKATKLADFHRKIFENYQMSMDNTGNVLDKMKQFWIYFSYCFKEQHKVLKKIKKSASINKYISDVRIIFNEFELFKVV